MRRAFCSRSRCDGVAKSDMSTALNLISGAVQLVWGKAPNNYMDLAFVIHGRLFGRLSGMAAIDTRVSSVEMPAERRWLCAIK
jgi:hypothetical protein